MSSRNNWTFCFMSHTLTVWWSSNYISVVTLAWFQSHTPEFLLRPSPPGYQQPCPPDVGASLAACKSGAPQSSFRGMMLAMMDWLLLCGPGAVRLGCLRARRIYSRLSFLWFVFLILIRCRFMTPSHQNGTYCFLMFRTFWSGSSNSDSSFRCRSALASSTYWSSEEGLQLQGVSCGPKGLAAAP